ncbi:MAG TPA: adenylosuccinate lyase, partial [Gemmatales bacterium]|nr:adenylosuccinate lyase [Gemmatales bacterium]
DGVTPRISLEQLLELRQHADDIDFERAAAYESRFRHDVMAHIHAYGDVCPSARGIIHLGATSCDVTDNADLILIREGLALVRLQLAAVIAALAEFAEKWQELPTPGYTHFQPAQLTTVGKRACLWLYDLVVDLYELEKRLRSLVLRGLKGTTGTQASFLALFHGDDLKVRQLEALLAQKLGWSAVQPVTGQTYTRKVDSQVLDLLSGIAQSGHKFATDLRLLQHHHELEEPFESEQVGSSAMAYKRNPMRAERLCGLARFVMNLTANAAQSAANQWLERTLDDSVNRRLSLPQAFLATDALLQLYLNIVRGMVVHPEMVKQNVERELPFMATENVLMAAVRAGGDRQQLHELIRQHSQAAQASVKAGGPNDLLVRLMQEPAFLSVDIAGECSAERFTGRASQQVQEFLTEVVRPLLAKYPEAAEVAAQIRV